MCRPPMLYHTPYNGMSKSRMTFLRPIFVLMRQTYLRTHTHRKENACLAIFCFLFFQKKTSSSSLILLKVSYLDPSRFSFTTSNNFLHSVIPSLCQKLLLTRSILSSYIHCNLHLLEIEVIEESYFNEGANLMN